MPTATQPPHYQYPRPIRTVAVIGAGAAGCPAARQLREHGLKVRVFERQDRPGGVWNWSPDIAPPLSVPTPPPSRGAFKPVLPEVQPGPTPTFRPHAGDKRTLHEFSPPNPVYKSLSNNVPTSTMVFKDFPYPPNTPENIDHSLIAKYVHDYAEHFELAPLISFHTRVELVTKLPDGKWRLTLRKLVPQDDGTAEESYWTEDFDAVVAATGHYNAPHIPYIEGNDKWAAEWPLKILHSNGYREPAPYIGKKVLVIGVGTSGVEIIRDLDGKAEKVYVVGTTIQKGPEGYRHMREKQRQMLPQGAELIPEIKRFVPPAPGSAIEDAEIELVDGRVITGLSGVIFSTGYKYGYPFLPHLHRDPSPSASLEDEEVSRLMVTNGDAVLNLYRDVFWIPDPTLCTVGLSVNTSAFSFFEYQSIAAARVLSGQAFLPTQEAMREAYRKQVEEKGDGKFIHFMGQANERKYVRETVEWINSDAKWTGATPVEGHSEEWLAASDKTQKLIAAKYGIEIKLDGYNKSTELKEEDEKQSTNAREQKNGARVGNGAGEGIAAGGHPTPFHAPLVTVDVS